MKITKDTIVSFLKDNHNSIRGGLTIKEIAKSLSSDFSKIEDLIFEESRTTKRISAWVNQDPSVSEYDALRGELYWFAK